MANFATDITARNDFIGRILTAQVFVPAWFCHTPPDGMPTPPALPDVLPPVALEQVNQWLAGERVRAGGPTLFPPPEPTHPHAIAKVAEFRAYRQTAAYRAWELKNHLDREAMWINSRADAQLDNDMAVPISADPTGEGTPSATGYLARSPS